MSVSSSKLGLIAGVGVVAVGVGLALWLGRSAPPEAPRAPSDQPSTPANADAPPSAPPSGDARAPQGAPPAQAAPPAARADAGAVSGEAPNAERDAGSAPDAAASEADPSAASADAGSAARAPDAAPAAPQGDDPEAELRVKTRASIKSSIQTMKPIVRDCYETVLRDFPEANGTVVLTFSLVEQDQAWHVDLEKVAEESGLHDDALSSCMIDALRTVTFDMPEGASETKVTYPFRFASGDEGD